MNNKRANCMVCGKNYRTKTLHKYKGKLICKQCRNKELRKKGKFIDKIPQKVPESMFKNYNKKTTKPKPKPKPIKERVPGLKPIKKKQGRPKGMGLMSIEKYFLYKKYTSLGLSPKQATLKINEVVLNLKKIVSKMREEKKPEDEINTKFKEEFTKICQIKNV